LQASEHAFDHVLQAIATDSDPWAIVDFSDQPFNFTAEVIKLLEREGFLQFQERGVVLTEKGRALLRERGISPKKLLQCKTCGGSGVDFEQFRDAYEQYKEIAQYRPKPLDEFDQGVLTPEAAFRRLALMIQQGDVENKRLAILGDDDLMSIALALTGLPTEIITFELDERYVRYIEKISQDRRLPIRVIPLDLRDRLPEGLVGSCDTFLTDPPENFFGLMLFVERGLGCLKPGEGKAGYFGVTLTEASLPKWYKVERSLLENYAIVFTHIAYEFSDYENWDFLLDTIRTDIPVFRNQPSKAWYRSTFFRVETLADFAPTNDSFKRGDIYMDEERLVYSRKKGKG